MKKAKAKANEVTVMNDVNEMSPKLKARIKFDTKLTCPYCGKQTKVEVECEKKFILENAGALHTLNCDHCGKDIRVALDNTGKPIAASKMVDEDEEE